VFAPLLATRLALVVVGLVAVKQMPSLPGSQLASQSWINIWTHFDSGWYLNIARDGYQYVPGEPSNIAFFPLFPGLMRWVGVCFGGSDSALALGGLIVSNVSLVVALVGLWALARLECGREAADRSVLYALVFPTTLFLSAVYAMSLSLAIVVVAYYYARRGRWAAAGLIAALGGVVRPDGFVLALALAAEYMEQRQWRLRAVRFDLLWLALNPAACGCWLATQWAWYGTPLAFLRAQQGWHDSPIADGLLTPGGVQRLCIVALMGLLTLVAGIRLRKSYAVYGVFQMAIWIAAARMDPLPRYSLLLFPAFIALAMLTERRPWLHNAVVAVAMALASFNMVRFALGYFVS
jgi:hypothetical protein